MTFSKLQGLKKLIDLFSAREKRQFGKVMAATLTMAFFQALGIASILPFINMIMEPSIINENRWLWWAYNALEFTSMHSFIMFSGIMMLLIILMGNAISTFATWVKLRFVWQKNHSLSSSLLRKYLSLPYGYFLGHHSADLSKNILDEANDLTRSFLIPILSIVTQGTVVFFIFIMLLFVNPVVTFIVAEVLGGYPFGKLLCFCRIPINDLKK